MIKIQNKNLKKNKNLTPKENYYGPEAKLVNSLNCIQEAIIHLLHI